MCVQCNRKREDPQMINIIQQEGGSAMNENSEGMGIVAGKGGDQKSGPMRRIGAVLTKLLTLFVILEPIWMLLPFAGFLYGSVLHIQMLNQNPHTAWLTHFVFPVLTLGLTGPVLIIVGFALFLVGAAQIYWAKIRRSGLVTRGLYSFVRHPQYISLTLFGLGVLLAWGRAITFIAFFVMMFLYYYLTKSEEQSCIRIFGEEYERYRERTSYIIPGDKLLRPLCGMSPHIEVSSPLRVAGAFALTMAICFGAMWLVQSIKLSTQVVPFLTAEVPLNDAHRDATINKTTADNTQRIPFVQDGRIGVVRGPYRNARERGFAERVLQRMPHSKTLADFLAFLDEPGSDVLVVWCIPYTKPEKAGRLARYADMWSGGHAPAPDPYDHDRGRLVLMRCSLSPGAAISDSLADKSTRKIVQCCVAKVNFERPEGEDIVVADGCTRGPEFPVEQRWAFFLHQFEPIEKPAGLATGTATCSESPASARLVLVQAPVLRARVDPAFAKEILHRLVSSETFQDRMRRAGVGGNVIAVAFPRPGSNWYQRHHGKPQVSVLVMLARLTGDKNAPLDDLFRAGGRELSSAFVAPVDLNIDPPADSVGQITMSGPRRDLEEQWSLFLSGLGAGSPRDRR